MIYFISLNIYVRTWKIQDIANMNVVFIYL